MAELLTTLDYNNFFKEARNKDTEALIDLLYQYQQNMTPQLQEELAGTGIPQEDTSAPINYAESLRVANISQEAFKGSRKVSNAGVVQVYNDIYLEVISKISKLASVFFSGNKAQQQLISYNAILKAMSNYSVANKAGTPPAQ